QYAQANLRVDLSLEAGEVGTARPLRDYQVGRVLLTSLMLGMVHDAPAWAPWINTRPLNAPIVTDASGSTTLWFAVNPHPHLAGVHFSPEDGKANAPVVALYDVAGDPHWVIRDEQRGMLAPDHWWIRLRLVERTDHR
ncbi:MAG TPA: hypothetical protein VD866_04435, partial [Urbifossiella sp.]|nr:hypothetical protein [Urbifossiella sp.]